MCFRGHCLAVLTRIHLRSAEIIQKRLLRRRWEPSLSTCGKTGPDRNTATAVLRRREYSGMTGILNKKKDGFWTDLKQTADVPCVLHAHCSPDVGPRKINTCEGPLSLSLSKLFHFLDSEGSQLDGLWLLFPSCWSPIQSLHRRFCNLFHPNEDQHYKHQRSFQ